MPCPYHLQRRRSGRTHQKRRNYRYRGFGQRYSESQKQKTGSLSGFFEQRPLSVWRRNFGFPPSDVFRCAHADCERKNQIRSRRRRVVFCGVSEKRRQKNRNSRRTHPSVGSFEQISGTLEIPCQYGTLVREYVSRILGGKCGYYCRNSV